MKIIHEIYRRAQCGAGLRPYARMKGDERLPTSGYADVTIVCPATENEPEEALHIEGDFQMLRTVLGEALGALEMAAESLAERGELAEDWDGGVKRR